MFQDRLDLFTGDARKPFEEIIDRGTAFDIFEKRRHGYPRALEQPGPAYLSRHPLNL
jgi:hypothetical protein